MRIHITRHGQPAQHVAATDNHQYPPGDSILSEQGREQATLLGKHLGAHNFRGPIFSSPYRRTLETAEMIARETGAFIFPTREIQEWIPGEGRPSFDGLTLVQIQSFFTCIAPEAELVHPWFFSGPEGIAEVQVRARPFLQKLCEMSSADSPAEVLLVGHGASTGACINELAADRSLSVISEDPAKNWNCSLSTIEVKQLGQGEITAHFSTGHLPDELVTSNQARYMDEKNETAT